MLFSLFALAACSMPPPNAAPFEAPTENKLSFNVKQIVFVDDSANHTQIASPSNDHFDPTLPEAVRIWARAHLNAAGGIDEGVFKLKSFYVTEEALPTKHDWMTRQQASKYVGHLEVEFEIKGDHHFALASTEVTHSASMPEHPSGDEKQAAYRTMLDGLIADLGKYFNEAAHAHMYDEIVTAPVLQAPRPPVMSAEPVGQNP